MRLDELFLAILGGRLLQDVPDHEWGKASKTQMLGCVFFNSHGVVILSTYSYEGARSFLEPDNIVVIL